MPLTSSTQRRVDLSGFPKVVQGVYVYVYIPYILHVFTYELYIDIFIYNYVATCMCKWILYDDTTFSCIELSPRKSGWLEWCRDWWRKKSRPSLKISWKLSFGNYGISHVLVVTSWWSSWRRYKESYKTIKQFEGNENPLAVAKDLWDLSDCRAVLLQ